VKAILNNIILFLVVGGVMSSTLDKLIIIGNYELNKTYIAEHYCINKSKPCKHCNGKCYMQKQLQNNAKKDAVPPGNDLKEKFQQQLFCESNTINLANFVSDFKYSLFINFAPSGKYGLGVFHPPTV
jgi:hypothetical protein